MSTEKPHSSKFDQVRAEQIEYNAKRESGYREKALKIYPWICGRCTREFNRKNLSELTVHHIDHDHGNNPGDGSNWELLCLYCHDNEHQRLVDPRGGDATPADASATHQPFAGLADLLREK